MSNGEPQVTSPREIRGGGVARRSGCWKRRKLRLSAVSRPAPKATWNTFKNIDVASNQILVILAGSLIIATTTSPGVQLRRLPRPVQSHAQQPLHGQLIFENRADRNRYI